MAAKSSHKKNQRRPALKRSPLSAVKKPVNKTVPKAPKLSTKKSLAKKLSSSKLTKPEAKKTTPRKKTVLKAKNKKVLTPAVDRQIRLIILPLGRKTRLSLTLTRPLKTKTKASSKTAQRAKTILLIVAGLTSSIFFGLKVAATPAAPPIKKSSSVQRSLPAPVPVKKSLPLSRPLQLRIADIQLNASIGNVGLDNKGAIEVPADYQTTGWYELSPTPGELGPSVIVGHLDNIKGVAVFWRLRELVPGQMIEVDRQDGTTAKFVVQKLDQYTQENYPASEVYGNTDYAGLRLITCGGTFNRLTGHYTANTVVYAALVL